MTALLIDTHALLWWLTADRRLPDSVRKRLADRETRVLVSAASAWEVSIKKSIGKLSAPDDLFAVVGASGFDWIPIEPEEAYAAGGLPMHHRDPFDRLIVAQSLGRSLPVVTNDEIFEEYGAQRVWF